MKVQLGEVERPIREILEDFQKPVPNRFLKTKKLGGNDIQFIPWYHLIKLLEYRSPGFEWEIKIDFCV